jgi:AcrR family transcriptional regulator
VLDVGFDDLTFAAVAERLGIAQATLYRHAPNRDALVRLGMDLALRRWSWPSLDGPWREVLERWALASWRAWEAHPGAVAEATRGVVPPSMVALSDELAVMLLRAGFGGRQPARRGGPGPDHRDRGVDRRRDGRDHGGPAGDRGAVAHGPAGRRRRPDPRRAPAGAQRDDRRDPPRAGGVVPRQAPGGPHRDRARARSPAPR